MKNKNNTIRIKNELPELLEAVFTHKDCPEWLQDAIWEAFNNQHLFVTFTANYWSIYIFAPNVFLIFYEF